MQQKNIEIRQAEIAYLQKHTELVVEIALTNCDSWESLTYLQRMATSGNWCDDLIIKALANQFNFVIHIIQSTRSCPNGTKIMPLSGYHVTIHLWDDVNEECKNSNSEKITKRKNNYSRRTLLGSTSDTRIK